MFSPAESTIFQSPNTQTLKSARSQATLGSNRLVVSDNKHMFEEPMSEQRLFQRNFSPTTSNREMYEQIYQTLIEKKEDEDRLPFKDQVKEFLMTPLKIYRIGFLG